MSYKISIFVWIFYILTLLFCLYLGWNNIKLERGLSLCKIENQGLKGEYTGYSDNTWDYLGRE